MLSTLLRRNVTLMIGVVLAGQVIAGIFVLQFVMRPQIERVASVTADMVAGLSQGMSGMSEAERAALFARIGAGGDIAIRERLSHGARVPRFPNYIERQFIAAMTRRLSAHSELDWRKGDGNRLWFRLDLGGRNYWISATPPTQRSGVVSMVYAFAAAFVVSIIAGYLLQRRLDAPLRRLASEVEEYDPVRDSEPVATDGPAEIAAVAGAFNRMAERVRAEEAERSLMLGGVSHDLRTPLTRLRLCLEMMHCDDAELEATAARQVDRIEAMLAQFLDFARGFSDEVPAPCDLGTLLCVAARDAAPEGMVALDVEDGLQAPLRRDAVARAVGNLLGNALRHGQAPVGLAARRTGHAIEIVVSDAGEGFDAATAQRLLRPFARGDSARSGDGAGLGLAIAERVATAHGGTLSFERRDGRFCAVLRLPVAG